MPAKRAHPHALEAPQRPEGNPSISGEYRISVPERARPAVHPGRYSLIPEPGGVVDELHFEYDYDIHAEGALELPEDRALATPAPSPPSVAPPPVAPPPQRRPAEAPLVAVDPHDALVAFAGFRSEPKNVWGTPSYSIHALRRRRQLHRELEVARAKRSHDVALYESALRTMDVSAVRSGVAVIVAFSVLGTGLVVALVELARSLAAGAF